MKRLVTVLLLTTPCALAAQAPPESLFDAVMQGQNLPDVSLPAAPAAVPPATPTTPQAPVPETQQASLPIAAPTPVSVTSIGRFDLSIMYSEEDISNLGQVLAIYESQSAAPSTAEGGAPTEEGDLLAELLRAAQEGEQQPQEAAAAALPSFYLGSILYRRAGDWSLWVNRERFTPQQAEQETLGLRVASVSRERATLVWKPVNRISAIERWKQVQENKPETGTHRQARQASVAFDESTGEFTVSLRPNQTFVAESMMVMEGRTGLLSTAEEAAAASMEQRPATANPPPRNPNATERELADKLIRNVKQADEALQQAAP